MIDSPTRSIEITEGAKLICCIPGIEIEVVYQNLCFLRAGSTQVLLWNNELGNRLEWSVRLFPLNCSVLYGCLGFIHVALDFEDKRDWPSQKPLNEVLLEIALPTAADPAGALPD